MGSPVVALLRNPHMPDSNRRTKERNIFGIMANGWVFQWMEVPIALRSREKISHLHTHLWYRRKQRLGWIPITVTSEGEIIDHLPTRLTR